MIPAERKSELLLREDRPKVIIYEFFNTIAPKLPSMTALAMVGLAGKADNHIK